MIRLLISVLWLLFVAAPASAQTIIWFSGCETDQASNTTLGDIAFLGSAATCSTTPTPKTGNYVLRSVTPGGTGVAISTAGRSDTSIFMRFQFQWLTQSANQYILQCTKFGDSKWIGVAQRASDKVLYWSHNNLTPIAAGSTALTSGTYYKIDVHLVVSATVGGVELKINDVVEFTSLGTDTSDLTSIDRCYIGPANASGSTEEIFDDMMMCTGAYCPSGRVVARQGKSGTPTYNAWTKNSCTSSLIENCWSQTPLDTTPNASSVVSTDAQTMVVHDFGTAQTGHGTETIGAHDTINACNTIMIAKSSVAGSVLSMRRRINGVDTTGPSPSQNATDTAYTDGIWTTTADILRDSTKLEIGAVHGAGVATDTVEEEWLMCDYLATTVPTRHRVTQ